MYRGRRMKVGRTFDQEKIIAQTLIKFLEDGNRKKDMFVHELRQIYSAVARVIKLGGGGYASAEGASRSGGLHSPPENFEI